MRSTDFYYQQEELYHIGENWDKLAQNEETAIDFAHMHINEEPEVWIDYTHYSLEYSLAHDGATINHHYREYELLDLDNEDIQVAQMVATHTTDTDLILYRGVNDDVYESMTKNAHNMDDCDLYEKGFLATSLVKGHEINTKIKLRIYAPAGTKCVYMGNVNMEQFYYEVDVMHSAKLKIISMDDEYINCELLETA